MARVKSQGVIEGVYRSSQAYRPSESSGKDVNVKAAPRKRDDMHARRGIVMSMASMSLEATDR
jgi:hypothetical protein